MYGIFKYGVILLAALTALFGNRLKAVGAVNTLPSEQLIIGLTMSWWLDR